MKNKIKRQIKNQQIDKMLEEQYNTETKILESALLKAAGKTSWDEFPEESEETVQREYDRLITRLKAKGEYRESVTEDSSKMIKGEDLKEVKEHLNRLDNEWNRTHRLLKPIAAVVAAAMLTALTGMTVASEFQVPEETAETYETSILEKK